MQLKKDRNKFETYLENIDMLHYLNKIFDNYGIYTFSEFYLKFNSINDLNDIINNNNDAHTIFTNTPKYISQKNNNINNSNNNIPFDIEGQKETQNEGQNIKRETPLL